MNSKQKNCSKKISKQSQMDYKQEVPAKKNMNNFSFFIEFAKFLMSFHIVGTKLCYRPENIKGHCAIAAHSGVGMFFR